MQPKKHVMLTGFSASSDVVVCIGSSATKDFVMHIGPALATLVMLQATFQLHCSGALAILICILHSFHMSTFAPGFLFLC